MSRRKNKLIAYEPNKNTYTFYLNINDKCMVKKIKAFSMKDAVQQIPKEYKIKKVTEFSVSDEINKAAQDVVINYYQSFNP